MADDDLIALRGVRYVVGRVAATGWRRSGASRCCWATCVRLLVPGLRSLRLVVDQMDAIGVGSLGLVFVVSLFTGAVAAVQAAYQFSSVVPLKYLGSVILRSVIIELGPVLTALVVGGRVGASIAAELGTMKVTEQIDALRAMAHQPGALPGRAARGGGHRSCCRSLTIFADAIAIFGGFVVAVTSIGVTHAHLRRRRSSTSSTART